MITYFKHQSDYLFIILAWFVIGYFLPMALYVVIPFTLVYLYEKNQYMYLFLLFWYVLILSDTKIGFYSTHNLKIVYVVFLFYIFVVNSKINKFFNIYKRFIPFTIFALFSMASSPILFTAFQKTISYLFIIILGSGLTGFFLKNKKYLFLQSLIYFGSFILFTGIALRPVLPEFVIYVERFSGFLGNPNGLGIFCILYTILWLVIKYYYPYLFKKKTGILINLLILVSVVYSASRGALLAVSMFYLMDYSVRRNNPFIIVMVVVVFIGFFFVNDIVGWLYSIGIGEYFRAQTLLSGSGRVVAYEFAWEQIKLNPLLGKGFGYSEYWFHLEDIQFKLNMLNHQGNTHNSFLTILMDTGFIGLFWFLFAWGGFFSKAFKLSVYALPVLIVVLFSSNVEAWLAASLNPFTIILIIILSLLGSQEFIKNNKPLMLEKNKNKIYDI